MPVKAPTPVVGAYVPLDVHGYLDLTFASTRVTNGGLYLYPTGHLTWLETGLSIDLYKSPSGFINSFSVFGGIWNEWWSSPPPYTQQWQEMDWWIGFSVGFAQNWKLTAQHVQFQFPGNGPPTAYNYDIKLSYDDSWTGWWITFNPYVDFFYNAQGGSTVVLGNKTNTYRVSIGMTPTMSFAKAGLPLTITVPTWVTVGPSSFWNRQDGTTNFCGPYSDSICSSGNTGYWSTGLQAKYALDGWVPKRYGSWYVKGGVQYYHIVNDSLLGAQTQVGSAMSFNNAKRDIAVWTGGLGFAF